MRVLIIDQANFIGGAEKFNLDLLNHLNHAKYKIFLLTSGYPEYQRYLHPRVNTYIYAFPRLKRGFWKYWHLLRAVFLVRQIVKKEKIDLIQSNTIRGHVIAAFAKKIFRLETKLVWFVHDFSFPQKVLQKLITIPNLILTCSQAVKQDLLKKTSINFQKKIEVVYNGIALKNVSLETNPPLPFVKGAKKRVGIVGRLDPWKGQDVLIEAAAQVCQKNSECEFVIIGESSPYDQITVDFEKKLKNLVKNLNLQTKIHFLGKVDDIFIAIEKMDIVVHASTQVEPFGRVIIEAMSLGKIVIASNLGGPKEIITDGKDGFLIQPGHAEILAQKIGGIFADKQLCVKIGQNARKTVEEKFDLRKQVRRIEKLWAEVVN